VEESYDVKFPNLYKSRMDRNKLKKKLLISNNRYNWQMIG